MPPNRNSKPANFLSWIPTDPMHAGIMPQPPSQIESDDESSDFFSFFPDFKPTNLGETHPVNATAPNSLLPHGDSNVTEILHKLAPKKSQNSNYSNASFPDHPDSKRQILCHRHNPIFRSEPRSIISVNSGKKAKSMINLNPTPLPHLPDRGQQRMRCTNEQIAEFRQFFPDLDSSKRSVEKDDPLQGSLKISKKGNSIKKAGCIEKLELREKKKGLANTRAKSAKKRFSNEELKGMEQEIEALMGKPKSTDMTTSENRQALFEKYHLEYYAFPPEYVREVVQDVKEKHKKD